MNIYFYFSISFKRNFFSFGTFFSWKAKRDALLSDLQNLQNLRTYRTREFKKISETNS